MSGRLVGTSALTSGRSPPWGEEHHQGGVEPCPGRGIVRDLRRVYCRVGVTVHRRASHGG